MSRKPEKVHVQIKYGDVTQDFSANPQESWLLLSQFFKQLIPSFEVANMLLLKVDIQQLAKDIQGVVAFSSDGPVLLSPKGKLTDNETLSIWLTAQYLGNELGLVKGDDLSKEGLQMRLGKSGKIVSTRLGELVKSGFVTKTGNDKFRITSHGIAQTQKEVLRKVREKTKLQ